MVDVTTQGATSMDLLSPSEEEDKLELIDESGSSERVKKVVVASVLASLSIAVAPIVEIVPRIPGWGIALFDPVSLFWIVSFLIGGIWVGLVSTVAGTIGVFLYDPTAIGPVMKLIATLPMIIVPWLGVRRLRREVGGESLSNARFFFKFTIIAFIVRILLMVPINVAYGAIAYPFFTIEFIVTYAIILNAVASFWDALVPYILVHKTQVFKTFKMW
jgi:hypothetical protein